MKDTGELRVGSRVLLSALEAHLREARGWTQALLKRAPDTWLYPRVEWTDCTLGWHMGHLASLQDVYAYSFLGAAQRPEASWRTLFGDGSQPQPAADYPAPAELRAAFVAAHERLLAHLATLTDDDLTRSVGAAQPQMSVLRGIARVLMHEAEHFAGIETLLLYFERLETAGA